MTANDAGLVARRCEVSAWHKEPQDYCNSKSMVLQVGSLNPLVFRKIFSQSCARVMSYQSAHDATVMLIFSNHIAVVWLQVQSPNQQNQRPKTGVSKSVSFCDTQANAVRFLPCQTHSTSAKSPRKLDFALPKKPQHAKHQQNTLFVHSHAATRQNACMCNDRSHKQSRTSDSDKSALQRVLCVQHCMLSKSHEKTHAVRNFY